MKSEGSIHTCFSKKCWKLPPDHCICRTSPWCGASDVHFRRTTHDSRLSDSLTFTGVLMQWVLWCLGSKEQCLKVAPHALLVQGSSQGQEEL